MVPHQEEEAFVGHDGVRQMLALLENRSFMIDQTPPPTDRHPTRRGEQNHPRLPPPPLPKLQHLQFSPVIRQRERTGLSH